MELKGIIGKISTLFSKYRFVLLILLIGVVLMILPSKSDSTEGKNVTQSVSRPQVLLDEELSKILSLVDGAGRVQVLLTTGEGEETIYQTDTDISSDGSGRHTTITVSDAQRTQTGLVQKVNPPTYQGAIVVCDGADDPQVRLAIVDAVADATGLGSNCISVLKMK